MLCNVLSSPKIFQFKASRDLVSDRLIYFWIYLFLYILTLSVHFFKIKLNKKNFLIKRPKAFSFSANFKFSLFLQKQVFQ